jgi:hypothetical protein
MKCGKRRVASHVSRSHGGSVTITRDSVKAGAAFSIRPAAPRRTHLACFRRSVISACSFAYLEASFLGGDDSGGYAVSVFFFLRLACSAYNAWASEIWARVLCFLKFWIQRVAYEASWSACVAHGPAGSEHLSDVPARVLLPQSF